MLKFKKIYKKLDNAEQIIIDLKEGYVNTFEDDDAADNVSDELSGLLEYIRMAKMNIESYEPKDSTPTCTIADYRDQLHKDGFRVCKINDKFGGFKYFERMLKEGSIIGDVADIMFEKMWRNIDGDKVVAYLDKSLNRIAMLRIPKK